MDIDIQAREIKRNKKALCEIIARHTGKKPAQIEEDSHWDFFMSAQEACDYGIVDEVIDSLKSTKSE